MEESKCYKIVCYVTSKVEYYVYADNKETAVNLVENGLYTDKNTINSFIEDILECEEEK